MEGIKKRVLSVFTFFLILQGFCYVSRIEALVDYNVKFLIEFSVVTKGFKERIEPQDVEIVGLPYGVLHFNVTDDLIQSVTVSSDLRTVVPHIME